jgi:hypothetical protein
MDGALELRRELQLVLDYIVQLFAYQTRLCLREFAQFGLHMFDFAHLPMIG